MRRSVGISRTTLNIPTSKSGVPGEEEEQEIENIFEQIMQVKFPNMAKEIDLEEVQEAQNPEEAGPKEAHTKAHQNYISQD